MNVFLMYSKGLSETMAISCDTISTCSSPHIVNQITLHLNGVLYLLQLVQ